MFDTHVIHRPAPAPTPTHHELKNITVSYINATSPRALTPHAVHIHAKLNLLFICSFFFF